MSLFSDKSYIDMYLKEGIKVKKKPTVLHQKTCPLCGRKLVNLYYSEKIEKHICKKCTDESKGEPVDAS